MIMGANKMYQEASDENFSIVHLLLILEERTKHPGEGLAYWNV
jgi:hypothetical protein